MGMGTSFLRSNKLLVTTKRYKIIYILLLNTKKKKDASKLIIYPGNHRMNLSRSAVVRQVIREIKKSIYFTIITGSTPESFYSEQINFTIRFLHLSNNQQWEVEERLLKLEDLEKKKGADIAKLILNVLEKNELDIKSCRGQGYDNGANMAGIYNGVQALIRQNIPQAIFIPCSAHSLNLCGVHAIESLAFVKSYLEIFQSHTICSAVAQFIEKLTFQAKVVMKCII